MNNPDGFKPHKESPHDSSSGLIEFPQTREGVCGNLNPASASGARALEHWICVVTKYLGHTCGTAVRELIGEHWYLRRGKFRFNVGDRTSVWIKTGGWFGSWERVFYHEYWETRVPEPVQAAVVDVVWELVREADRKQNAEAKSRWSRLLEAVGARK